MKISGPTAWETAAGHAQRRWGHNLEAFERVAYPIYYAPKFKVGAQHKFFCLGSCFVRNIEEHLIYRDVTVLSKQLRCPRSEWPNRPNGIVNKFTAHSMLNEVRWLERPVPAEKEYYLPFGAGWLDPQLSPGSRPVDLDRAMERRAYLTADYFARMASADVVIVTLGFNEVWLDAATGLRLNMTPPLKAVHDEPDRYSVEITSVAENLEALEEMRDRLVRRHPGLRFIVTVSPVPLDVSFSGQDIVVANMRSKSVLRVTAEEFARQYADVDYFPSYEMVVMAPAAKAYMPDHGHVTDRAVGEIISLFLRSHGIEAAVPDFDERTYLAANPEVDHAVRAGEIISGFHHWQSQGMKERPASHDRLHPHSEDGGQILSPSP